MRNEMNLKNKIVSVAAVFLLSLFIVSCGGKKEEPAPAAAQPVPTAGNPGAPAPAPAPTVSQSLGDGIEAQSPGTPIGNDSNSWNALSQRFRDNVTFQGQVTVSAVTGIDYTITNAYSSSPSFARSNQQNLSNSTPTLYMQAYGDTIYVQSPYMGSQSYSFQSQVSLYGLVLKSTEIVGLYLSNDGSSLLKVQYNVKNPPIQMYQIQNNGGAWGSIMIRVIQKPINTAGVVIRQY